MTRAGLGLILALCFGVSLVVSAPARLLNRLLPEGQVLAQGFDGSLWRGSATSCLVKTDAGYLHLGVVQWSLDPLSLLLFAPRLTLHSVWGDQVFSGEVVVRGSGALDLHEFEAQVAADLLRQFAPVALGGTLSAQVETLILRDGLPHSGNGRLVWRSGSWQSPQGLLPLGSYAVDFQQEPERPLQGQVLTVSGPVEANGTVQLEGGAYSLDILVAGKGALDPQLEQALSLLAAPSPEGFRVKLSGEF